MPTLFLQAAPAAQPQGGGLESLILMGGVMIILYFFMIRPQMQRQKKEKKFREALKKGDKVITIGGLHGTIVHLEDKLVTLKVDDNVKMRFDRAAIREYTSVAEGETAQ